MSDTESFESIVNAAMEKVHENYEIKAIEVAGILGTLSGAHDREIRDTAQQQYDRGFNAGQHSMDAEHRTIAMRLRALPLDGGSHENLSQIARAVYHADFGWTQGACAALRDELVRLMGGVSDGTAKPMTTDEFIEYINEDTRRLKGEATKAGDDSDTCACAGGGACAADCGGDSGEQEVSDGGTANDCADDSRGWSGSELVHLDGVTYDVLDNERRKAIANLRKLSERGNVWGRELIVALGLSINASNDDMCDRLIHLLGGDQPSGIDVLREMEANGTCQDNNRTCPNYGPMVSITDELREWAKSDVWSCRWEEFEAIADRIDERAKHDRESDQLRIEKLVEQRDELVEQRDELRLIIADVVEERDMWKATADTNTNALLRIGGENARLHADCERLRKRLDSITETIERIKSIGQE